MNLDTVLLEREANLQGVLMKWEEGPLASLELYLELKCCFYTS